MVSPNIIESVRSRVNLESRNGICLEAGADARFISINACNTFEKALFAKPILDPSWIRNPLEPNFFCLSDPTPR
jgi:hypothetical protein